MMDQKHLFNETTLTTTITSPLVASLEYVADDSTSSING